jgi:hypothetical protein
LRAPTYYPDFALTLQRGARRLNPDEFTRD